MSNPSIPSILQMGVLSCRYSLQIIAVENCTMKTIKVKPRHQAPAEFEACRATDIGLEGLAECLQNGPNQCSYALPFGYCFLCRHPRLDEILEKTRKSKVEAAA